MSLDKYVVTKAFTEDTIIDVFDETEDKNNTNNHPE
jgi:hypothetical protein